MFTGIIEEVGRVRRVQPLGGALRLTIDASFAPELRVDQSVSINGACQTVVNVRADAFEVVTVEETLRKTNFGTIREGDRVNLERAMRPDTRLDGHLVQGHVDATAVVSEVEPEGTNRLYHFRLDPQHTLYVIPVGSIALDGISLTVARLEEGRFTIAIIPHTLEKTAVSANWTPGARVNVEFDMIGKYVIRWMERRGTPAAGPAGGIPDEAWLRGRGF